MPTYDFCCKGCGLEFELIGCPGRITTVDCPQCPSDARRMFTPPTQTQPGAGIFKPHFHFGLGKKVESRRQLKDEMKASGMVPKGSTSVKGRREPSEYEIEKGIRQLKRSEVLAAREKREHFEYRERNG